jgi:hypothetical protein
MKTLFLILGFLLVAGGAKAGDGPDFLGVADNYWFDFTGSWVASDVTMKVLPEDLRPLGPTAVFAGDFIYESINNPSEDRLIKDLALDAAGCGLSYLFNIKW